MLAISNTRWRGGGGELMVAAARDPNEEYFPLVVAVVEAKTKD